MKKLLTFLVLGAILSLSFFSLPKSFKKSNAAETKQPLLAIVVDDFGSYDQSGVDELLGAGVPLTCALLPNVDNTILHSQLILSGGHELILHMPMESHVNLPESWYGPTYIKNSDTPETAIKKLDDCIKTLPNVKGFNIHIGSGVSQNEKLMTAIYDYAKNNDLYFLDSRTIETRATENACKNTNSIYLGRDVFLEPNKNRTYNGVQNRLIEGANLAKEKGYAIVIGHVGAEGGRNTSLAIADTAPLIDKMGVKIVTLSEIYESLKSQTDANKSK